MKFHLQESFEPFHKDILQSIHNFNEYEAAYGTGKRNSVKKIDLSDKTIIIKSFKVPNFINQIIYRFIRKSKAQRSYEFASKLLERGINTPAPIAFLEKYSILGLTKSYYISEFVDCHLTYRELTNQLDYPEHEAILLAFTKFTYDLHQKEINFLDHSPGNTLIVKKNKSFEFYLVDLNRMQFGKLNFKARMKNFSKLTRHKDIVQIMSEEYAMLSEEPYEKIFKTMWYYTQHFHQKFDRKKRLKKMFFSKKNIL